MSISENVEWKTSAITWGIPRYQNESSKDISKFSDTGRPAFTDSDVGSMMEDQCMNPLEGYMGTCLLLCPLPPSYSGQQSALSGSNRLTYDKTLVRVFTPAFFECTIFQCVRNGHVLISGICWRMSWSEKYCQFLHLPC